MPMLSEFKSFLTKSNALALAVGVVIGGAVGKVVTAIVSDAIMPVVALLLPKGDWREAQIVLSEGVNAKQEKTVNAFRYGDLVGNAIDFTIIALVVFLIMKALLHEKRAPAAAPTTKACPRCLENVPLAATRCRACTSDLA